MQPTPINFQSIYNSLFSSILREFQSTMPQYFSMLKALWPYLFLMCLIGLGRLSFGLYKKYRLSKAGLYEIDKMTGEDFEKFLQGLFFRLGYKVEHTGKIGDFGCDLVIEKDGYRVVIQAKRYNNHVGEDAVREAYSVINLHKCNRAMVVTNSYFTPKAKILAQSDNVILWNRDALVDNILESQTTNTKETIFNGSGYKILEIRKLLSILIICIIGFSIGFLSIMFR